MLTIRMQFVIDHYFYNKNIAHSHIATWCNKKLSLGITKVYLIALKKLKIQFM
jgi:hypothetical protein